MDTNCLKRVLCVSVLLCVVTVLFPKEKKNSISDRKTLGKGHYDKELLLHDNGHLKVENLILKLRPADETGKRFSLR